MIKFLTQKEINKSKWDDCLNNSPQAIIYSLSWYLDIVSPNWSALVKGDYEAIMPLPTKKKFGINYIIQPIFVQQLGIYTKQILTSELEQEFLNTIPKKYKWIHLNMNESCDVKLYTKQNINLTLNINRPYSEIQACYSSKCRRNIKLSLKEETNIESSTNPEAFIKLFRSEKGELLPHLKDKAYEKLHKIISTAIANNRGELILGNQKMAI